jgi:hypothetical protein
MMFSVIGSLIPPDWQCAGTYDGWPIHKCNRAQSVRNQS